jgi:hypothetical protein
MNARVKPPSWEKRFGTKRRAIDRDILKEAEERIAANPTPAEEGEAMTQRLARAFGRPT